MAIQLSTAARNALLDAIGARLASGTIEVRSGAAPANCAAADSGTVLATITLDSTPFNAASGGTMSKADTLTDASADATGTAAHFRGKASGGGCEIQGTVATSGADMNLDSASFTAGQGFTITTFTLTAPNP